MPKHERWLAWVAPALGRRPGEDTAQGGGEPPLPPAAASQDTLTLGAGPGAGGGCSLGPPRAFRERGGGPSGDPQGRGRGRGRRPGEPRGGGERGVRKRQVHRAGSKVPGRAGWRTWPREDPAGERGQCGHKLGSAPGVAHRPPALRARAEDRAAARRSSWGPGRRARGAQGPGRGAGGRRARGGAGRAPQPEDSVS